ncbi:MAG TPA: hypothetical protein PLV59_02410 [Candidatus Dojkabacteria bacterium]|nr:hypothetical protein [Candidatus Dojkabacteria bacterium]
MRLNRNPEIFLKENTSPSIVVAAAEFLNPALFERNDYARSYAFLAEYVPFETALTVNEFNDYYYQAIGGAPYKMDEMVRRALPRVIHIANKFYAEVSGNFSAYDVFSTVYTEYQYTFFEMVAKRGPYDDPYVSHFSALNTQLKKSFDLNIDDNGVVYSNPSIAVEREYFDIHSLHQLYREFMDVDPEDIRLQITKACIKGSRNSFHDFVILYLSEVVNLSGREIGEFLNRGGSTAINARLAKIKGNILYHWRSHAYNIS